jgi:uncharacterized protein YcbK (DUF882 family)
MSKNLLTVASAFSLIGTKDYDQLVNRNITTNFKWGEVFVGIRPDREGIPSEWQQTTKAMLQNAYLMALQMEKARAYWKRPMRVTSWLRVPSHNERIGGHPNSFHMTGLAVDWQFTDGSLPTVAEYKKYRIFWNGGLGINRAKGFVHNDKGADRDVPY